MEITIKYSDEGGNIQESVINGSLPLIDFIEEILYMQKLYSNQRYTQAENIRGKLAVQLDDLMRLGY